MHRRARFARTMQQQVIEQTALDRDLALSSRWKIYADRLTADGDKLDGIELAVRHCPDLCRKAESFEDGPTTWIEAVAADFLPRKYFAVQNQHAQAGQRAEGGASRAGGAAPDNHDVKGHGRSWAEQNRFSTRPFAA